MSIYNNFCNKLIDNLNKNENKVIVIDLILDGGAFKGTYLLGALYYLKVLQERKFIKINRVSGCSIGALLGCLFLLNKLELFEKNDFKKLNDRLFINYYNIEKKKEKLISNYKSNIELSNFLKYTSFIPYFINGKTHYHGNIDGSKPYIFKNLNDSTITDIRKNSKLIKYEVGQPLSKLKIIPNRIHIVLEGQIKVSFYDPSNLELVANNQSIKLRYTNATKGWQYVYNVTS